MVWIKVKIRRVKGSSETLTSAYVNSGFRIRCETAEGLREAPAINIPVALANKLGFNIDRAEEKLVEAAGGTKVTTHLLGKVEVKVVTPDKETTWTDADAICIRGEDTVLISRGLGALLGLTIDLRGLWRLRDDPATTLRKEAEEEHWENT